MDNSNPPKTISSARNCKVGRPALKYSEMIVHKIEEALQYGLGVRIACEHAGISKSQYYDWIKERPEFMDRITAAKNFAILKAGQNVFKAIIEDCDPRISLQYLKAKLPEEFNEKPLVNVKSNLQSSLYTSPIPEERKANEEWNQKFKQFLKAEIRK